MHIPLPLSCYIDSLRSRPYLFSAGVLHTILPSLVAWLNRERGARWQQKEKGRGTGTEKHTGVLLTEKAPHANSWHYTCSNSPVLAFKCLDQREKPAGTTVNFYVFIKDSRSCCHYCQSSLFNIIMVSHMGKDIAV